MSPLRFKQEVEFNRFERYSVCLRGARRFDTTDEFDLSLYTPMYDDEPKAIANVVSQNHYRFSDLTDKDCADNYNLSARNVEGLKEAMNEVYRDFEEREIITILRFEVA